MKASTNNAGMNIYTKLFCESICSHQIYWKHTYTEAIHKRYIWYLYKIYREKISVEKKWEKIYIEKIYREDKYGEKIYIKIIDFSVSGYIHIYPGVELLSPYFCV